MNSTAFFNQKDATKCTKTFVEQKRCPKMGQNETKFDLYCKHVQNLSLIFKEVHVKSDCLWKYLQIEMNCTGRWNHRTNDGFLN